MITDETQGWESQIMQTPHRRKTETAATPKDGKEKTASDNRADTEEKGTGACRKTHSAAHTTPRRAGWIEVVCGSMFSGKTEELIRRLRRAQFARQRIEIFKPRIDVRYSEEEVVSHDDNAIRSTPVESPGNILLMAADVDVVGIDEAQFFDNSLVDVCRQLADEGIRVIVAGLDMDFTGKPFGPIPALMATAEYVTKVHAVCVRCGANAQHSHRLTADQKLVVLGETDSYEPLCRDCFNRARNGR